MDINNHKLNFLVIGAAKSGTSSLHYFLGQHSQIELPFQKETHFLSGYGSSDFPENVYHNAVNSKEEYLKLFDNKPNTLRGEVCVSYLKEYETTIQNIEKFGYSSDFKIVAILRDPTLRAFSHYTELKGQKIEKLSFRSAIEKNLKGNHNRWWWQNYLQFSLYSIAIEAYSRHFGKDNVLLIKYEDFEKDSLLVVNQILSFLGVEKLDELDSSIRFKKSGIPKSYLLYKLMSRNTDIRHFLKKVIPISVGRVIKNSKVYQKILSYNMQRITISEKDKKWFSSIIEKDIINLENSTGMSLNTWKHH